MRLGRNASVYLFLAGAFAALTIPRAAQVGMFVDGVTYASIARNLAAGDGSFWHPFYTATLHPQFHEHLPLAFALQGAVFALFGDHLAVERIYSVATGALTGIGIVLLWRRSTGDARHDWLPVVLWLLPSTVTWSMVGNLLENTQALFTTLAVLTFVRSLGGRRGWAMAAGVCTAAAVLAKGPTGLFPLAAPVAVAAALPRLRRDALRQGTIMAGVFCACAAAVLLDASARTALGIYWHDQVAASMAGARGDGRWGSFARHLMGGVVLRMAVLLGILWIIQRTRRTVDTASMPPSTGGWTGAFFLLALAASIPILLSGRISGHYFVPAIPIYALAFAGLGASYVKRTRPWQPSAARRIRLSLGALGAVLLFASVACPLSGRVMEPRDVELVRELRSLSGLVPSGAVIGTCEGARDDWRLHAYTQRFFRIAVDADRGERRSYFIQPLDSCNAPMWCRPVRQMSRVVLHACDAPAGNGTPNDVR